MIYNINLERPMNDHRALVMQHIKDSGYKRILDLGGVLGPWATPVVTHYADCQEFKDVCYHVGERAELELQLNKPFFFTDLNKPETWDAILDDVKKNGKFDFLICTQTLEHLYNPEMCIKHLIPQVADKGFIGIPCKLTELKKALGWELQCRGFMPHRWIFSIREETGEPVLWAFPKLNFLEYVDLPWVDEKFTSNELSFYFDNGTIPIFVVEDKYIDFGTPQVGINYFLEELPKGI